MGEICLLLTDEIHSTLLDHLLPADSLVEQAGFLFADCHECAGGHRFECREWMSISADGCAVQTPWSLELTDQTRAEVIKRAHDLRASIIEFHSHPQQDVAAFSPSDLAGFEDFVPHVWWRLKGRPYGAVVVSPTGFDAVIWTESPKSPARLDRMLVGGRRLVPTGRTIGNWQTIDAQRHL